MNHYNNHAEGETKKKLLAYIGIGLAFLAACIVAGGFLLRSVSEEVAQDPVGIIYDINAIKGGWESMSEEEITAALNEKVEEGMINISMNTSPVFASGSAKGNLMIVNQQINTCPQKVELYRNDTGELIYTSGAISVGSKITSAALDVVLEAGVYECTAMFHSLDPETGATLGTAGAIVTITIQS